jgi:hypothetical protein
MFKQEQPIEFSENMAVCQNLVPLVNIKIAGKWMFIPLKMVLIGIDPYPYVSNCLYKKEIIPPDPSKVFVTTLRHGGQHSGVQIRQQHASIRLLGINLRLRWIFRFGPVMTSGGCQCLSLLVFVAI